TGAMRHSTLSELAERDGIRLPAALAQDWPPRLSAADEKGWFRFQRLYDIARAVLRTPDDIRRLIAEAAADDAADGSVWTEIQVDRSEEHTSELQSRFDLVCRLLLEKKNKTKT